MKSKQLKILYATFIFVCLLSSSYAQIAADVTSNKEDENIQINDVQNKSSAPQYIIDMLKRGQESEVRSDTQTTPNEPEVDEIALEARTPVFEDLMFRIKDKDGNYLDQNIGVKQDFYPSEPEDKYVRGTTITVEGRLWGGIEGREWNDETVYLYYNVTKSQYLANQAFYFGNGQYEVGSDLTDSGGLFSIDLVTSTLSSSPFSKVGDINILTWFNGSSVERLAGTPGAKNITFFGQMDIQHVAVVTNPSSPYSFTTRIVFDNFTTVQTSGTSYYLNLDWSGIAYDHSATHVFTALNNHVYSAIAPGPAEDTVVYLSTYDITQLGINYFVQNGTNPMDGEDYFINPPSSSYSTEETLLVDAYFDFTGTYLKGPQEIQMGSTVDFYANLSSSAGLVSGYDIDVYIRYGASTTYSHSNTTDGSGEITFSIYFDPTTYTDITRGISIIFRFYDSDFYPARFTNDTLTTILAVDIGSVTLTLDDNSIFYTTSMSLGFNVEIRDVNNNLAIASRFQLLFPGIGTEEIITATGSEDVTKIVPSYIIQNDFETIVITAMFEDGGTYKYYAPGSPSDSDSFNIYHSLTLTLYHLNGTVVSTPSTNEWNTTFWNSFSISSEYYRLTAVDQSGRNPIGAEISITFAGSTANQIVTAGVNYVDWTYTNLLAASFESYEAYLGDLVATGGAMPSPPTITLTVNVFGPDNNAPTIDDIIFSPDPYLLVPHDPYYNISLTVVASDVGSGVQNVTLIYGIWDPIGETYVYATFFAMTNVGPNTYQDQITTWSIYNQYEVRIAIYVYDYSGYGVAAGGGLQTNPAEWYDTSIAHRTDLAYPVLPSYSIGDVYGPVEESSPDFDTSTDPTNPYVDITVYMNDSIVYTGMSEVKIRVDRRNTITDVTESYYISNVSMTNIPGTNQYTYTLDMEYNYEYWVYYIGVDTAPIPNDSPLGFYGPVYVSAIDTTPPDIIPFSPIYNGTIANPNTIITFNVTITDTQTNVDSVVLSFDITMGDTTYYDNYTVALTRVGTSDVFTVQVDLSDFNFPRSGTYALLYSVTATDSVGNSDSVSNSLGVLNESSGGLGIPNLGAIIGGVAGGLVVILAGLFLWFNRHTIQTYAKKQTFKRRLRDYLREIIEDIKKDGLEGRYKDGLLKSWSVLEGIGREFYDLPRYRSQTPTEFGRLLAYRGKIESELINTLLFYFEKARYGFEEITEKDFNAGVRALLKLVDKIEVGEMKIES